MASRGKVRQPIQLQRGLQSCSSSALDCTSIRGAPISVATRIPLR